MIPPPPGMPFDGGKFQEEYLLNIAGNLNRLLESAPFAEPQKELRIWHLVWELLQFDPKKRLTATKAYTELQKIPIALSGENC